MDTLTITWLCQGGFLFDDGKTRIVIDPYMTNSLCVSGMDRMVAIPIPFEALKPDLVIFTHDHADHYNVETVAEIVKMYPNCKYAGPASAFNHFKKDGHDISKFQIANVGDTFEFCGVKISAVKAYHSDPLATGVVMKMGEKLIYVSGDSLYQPDLHKKVSEKTKGEKIDLMFVCINGKLGNMSDVEAANFVRELKPARAIPMHYGLFAKNTCDPKPFVETVRKMDIKCDEMMAGRPTKF